MDGEFDCPRAVEGPFTFGTKGHWRPDHTCSYCGSLSPEKFFEAVEAGAEVVPTDKNYKAYVGDHRKVYFQHFSDEDKSRFIDLFNARKMKLAFPGYFYTTPFFCQNAV